MVWTCEEERRRLCGEEDAGHGSAWQEEEGKTKEEVYGCREGRYASGGLDGRRRRRPRAMEKSDPLWRPLMGTAERRRRRMKIF